VDLLYFAELYLSRTSTHIKVFFTICIVKVCKNKFIWLHNGEGCWVTKYQSQQ